MIQAPLRELIMPCCTTSHEFPALKTAQPSKLVHHRIATESVWCFGRWGSWIKFHLRSESYLGSGNHFSFDIAWSFAEDVGASSYASNRNPKFPYRLHLFNPFWMKIITMTSTQHILFYIRVVDFDTSKHVTTNTSNSWTEFTAWVSPTASEPSPQITAKVTSDIQACR